MSAVDLLPLRTATFVAAGLAVTPTSGSIKDDRIMADGPDTHPDYEHVHEDALEPRHLIRRSDVILRAGILMLQAGTGSRRVAETMRALARSLDVDKMQAQVSFTEIVLTISRRGIFRTQVAEVGHPAVNADRIAELQRFAKNLPPHTTVAEVDKGLDAVVSRGHLYPAWAPPVAAGLACSSFAFLNNGGWMEILGVAVAASCGQYVRGRLARLQLNQLGVVLAASIIAGLIFLGLSQALTTAFDLVGTNRAVGFISSVLFLVPGFPLITATLDLARLDLAAGISRIAYAGLITLAAAIGMWGVASLVGLETVQAPGLGLPAALLLMLRMLATFGGVFGFAIVFNSPMRIAVVAGLIATVANTARLYLLDANVAPLMAAAIATFAVGLIASWVSHVWHLPRIIMSVPAVVIMIPGAAAYRGLVRFNEGNTLAALDEGIIAVLTVLGMAVGLASARMVTDPQWAYHRLDPPELRDLIRAPHIALPHAPHLPHPTHLPRHLPHRRDEGEHPDPAQRDGSGPGESASDTDTT